MAFTSVTAARLILAVRSAQALVEARQNIIQVLDQQLANTNSEAKLYRVRRADAMADVVLARKALATAREQLADAVLGHYADLSDEALKVMAHEPKKESTHARI